MFKFNFQPEELNDEFQNAEASESNTTGDAVSSPAIPCAKCVEILPTTEQLRQTPETLKHGLILFAGGQEIFHLKSDVLIDDLIEDEIAQRLDDERQQAAAQTADNKAAADQHATDLIPGVYEGGGKIWECTQDLGDFLSQEDEETGLSLLHTIAGRNVLDLGCGAGILGALTLRQGAHVHFQDYNREILSKVTIPNAVLNSFDADATAPTTDRLERCRFFAGDWSHFVSHAEIAKQRYDLIVTCETIYNPANNQKIIDVLKRLLRPRTGVAYLAAKTYYFGVGGGLRSFEALLLADGSLRSEVVWQTSENVQREILRIVHDVKDDEKSSRKTAAI